MNCMNSERLIRACEAQINALLRHRGLDHRGDRAPARPGEVLYTAADHCSSASGAKRGRPRLVAAFGHCIASDDEQLVSIAVAGELIHAASLVHDDVIDDGTVRRGVPTVNALWSNLTAVLTGDLMFSLAFAELADSPRAVMNAAVDVLREMSCAAIDEADARGRLDLSLEQWRSIAEGKTGALFGWCGKAVGLCVADADAAARFDRCGRKLGVAFQLADDLKDLIAPGGKDRFQDIRNQNPSFPLLWAFHHDDTIRSAFEAAWAKPEMSDADVERLGAMVLTSAAIGEAKAALDAQNQAALQELGPYQDTVGGREIASWSSALTAIIDEGLTVVPLTNGAEQQERYEAPTEGAA